MVSVENITVAFGGFTLLDAISFVVNPKERIALTGKNGAGKSTMLKIIAGLQQASEGVVSMPKGFKVGYLPQVMNVADTTTVFEETKKAFDEIFRWQHRADELQLALSERTDYESAEYQRCYEELNQTNDLLAMSGLNNYQAEIEKTLLGLGFERTDFERGSNEFSGGWRMRIELAKVLLGRPDILLLDEPTNHLDIESIQWLEQFLSQHAQAVIVVSHDRAFLDNVSTRTLEISLGRLYDYKVPYSQFVELRKERREQQLRAYANQQKMIQDTEAFIERFRYKATKAVQVQSRIKQLDKLERLEVDEEDTSVMNLKFPPAPHCGAYPVIAEEVRKDYGAHNVFSHVNLTLSRGEKVAFVGRNGEGKSTLVKCILGEIPFEGKLQTGHLVKTAYFAQNQPQLLDGSLTVFETVDRVAVGDIRTKIRDILGAFRFGGEASDKKVSVLSGGERSRLAMIRLLLEPANLLILDEPTNHLDLPSKDVLKQAICDYDGTVIVVSHDRDFLDGLVSKVYEFTHGRVIEHIGGIREFLDKKKLENLRDIELTRKAPALNEPPHPSKPQADQSQTKDGPSSASSAASSASALSSKDLYLARKESARQLQKLQRQLSAREEEVAACEAALAEAEAAISTPEGASDVAMIETYTQCRKALDTAMSYWEEAAGELESFEKNALDK